MHDELFSLRRLALQDCEATFTRATISWRRTGHRVTWSGTAIDVAVPVAIADGDEVTIVATTLDGREVEGRAVASTATGPELLTFTGSGPLFVAGREL